MRLILMAKCDAMAIVAHLTKRLGFTNDEATFAHLMEDYRPREKLRGSPDTDKPITDQEWAYICAHDLKLHFKHNELPQLTVQRYEEELQKKAA